MLRTAEGSDALRLEVDGLVYTLDRPPAKTGQKVVLSASVAGSDAPPFVDATALYAFKARRALAQAIAEQFGREVGQVLGHLAVLIDQVERAEGARLRPASVCSRPSGALRRRRS